jgi:hypothetical protein
MQIRYSIALEDHKAWQGAVRSAWPGFLMIRCTQSIGGPGFLLFCVWLFTYAEHGWWPTILATGPALALGYYLWRASPGLWRKAKLDMLHHEGKLNGHLGEHTLEVRSDGLLERNAAGEHLSRWAEIENVYTTPQHTFFVTKTQLAYVLPKQSVLEGNYDQFIETARACWKRSGG